MAKDNESIEIKVEVDTSDVKKSMQDVSKETDKMAKNIKKSGDKAEDSFDGLTKGLKTIDKQMKNMFKNMNMNGFTSSINKAMKQTKQTVSNTAKSMTKVLDNVFGKKRTMEVGSTLTTDASGGVSGHTALLNSMLTGGAIGSQTAKQMALMKDGIIEAVKGSQSSFNGLSDTMKSTIVDAVMVGQDALKELQEMFDSLGIKDNPMDGLQAYIDNLTEDMEHYEEKIKQVRYELNDLYQQQAEAEANGFELEWSDGGGVEDKIQELKQLEEEYERTKQAHFDYQSQLEYFQTLKGFDGLINDINELANSYNQFKDNKDLSALIAKLEQYRNVVKNAGGDTTILDNAIAKYNENMKNSSIVTAKTKDAIQGAVQEMNNHKRAADDAAKASIEYAKNQNSITHAGKNLYGSLKQLVSGFKSVSKEQDNMAKSAKKTESAFKSLAKSLAPYLGLAAIFGGLKKSITSYTDSLQDSAKFSLVFGNEAQNMTDWLNGFNSTVTTSKSTLMDLSTNLYRMGINMDMTTQDAMNMSKEMTELGAHLASFTGDANSIEALASALRGEYDSLQNFGYALDADTVKTQALKMGLDASTESAKVMARQFLILDQSDDVLAFAAKNANSLSTQIAILQKNFSALGVAIGSCFAGLLQVVLPVLNSIVSAVTSAFNKIASVINDIFGLFGIQVGGGSASGGGSVGGAIGDAVGGISDALGSGLDNAGGGAGKVADELDKASGSAKELKKYLAGVDELNLTPEKSQPSGGSGSGSSGSGGSGGGAGGLGGLGDAVGGVATETESAADKVKDEIGEVADWIVKLVENLKSVWNALKTGFLSVSDYINTSIANLKQAFINLGNSMQSFLLGAWQNGGEQLVYNFGRLGGALTGAIIDIAGQCVQMVADLFAYLNPDTNPYTRMFITGLNNLLVACQNFALSVGGWFKTFVDNGGQAFLNVMGDIMMILGAIFTQLLADATNAITAFMNSWAGQTLISAIAISLDLVAGAVKAVLLVVKQFLPVFEALLLLFIAFKISKVINDFRTFNLTMLASQNATLTFGQKLAFTEVKLGLFKKSLVQCAKEFKTFITTGLNKGIKSIKDVRKNIVDLTNGTGKYADKIKKAGTTAKDFFLSIGQGAIKLVTFNAAQATGATTATAMATAEGAATVATTGLTVATTLLGVALAALGIGLIIAAIAGLIAIIRNWDTITEKVKATCTKAFNAIKKAVQPVWEFFKKLFQPIIDFYVGTYSKIFSALGKLFKPLLDGAKEAWNKLTEMFGWLGDACGWIADQFSWAWDKLKGFFGAKDVKNDVQPEVEETEESLGSLGDTIEETSDRFGTACSAINESLGSINIDTNKLALQLDEAEQTFNESFSRMSASGQEYLDALATGNQEVLDEMAGDSEKYLEEIAYVWDNLSQQEKAVMYATYGEINGITDGWCDYTKGSYEDALLAHVAYLENIDNNERLSAQEKDKLTDEATEKFKQAYQDRLAVAEQNIKDIQDLEGISQEEKNAALELAYQERDRIIDQHAQYEAGQIKTTDDLVQASAQTQKDAYNGVADEQEKALENVSTALEDTKTDLSSFKEESDKVAKEIPEAWAGIGETISEEFDEASNEVVKSLHTMNNKVKSQSNTLKTTLKSAFATINDGTKKSMTTMTNNIKQAFDKMSKNIKTQMQQIATELQARFTQINNGLNKSFTTMSTQVITVLKNMATQISSSLKGVETTFKTSMNNISNVAKTKIQEACKTITTKVEAMKQPITNSFNGIKTNVGNSLDALNKTVTNKMQVVLNTVKRFVNQLQNATNFTFKTPYMKMPHINVHGDWNFEKKTTPSFSVRWYSDGGIFNKRSLIGVGDKYHGIGNNPEMVMPLDSFWKELSNQFDKQTKVLSNNNGNESTTVVLNMDGREVGRGVVNNLKEMSRLGQVDMSWL